MTERELRDLMGRDPDTLPNEAQIEEWAQATGLTQDRVREIFGEVIGDPDPWGPPRLFDEDDDGPLP